MIWHALSNKSNQIKLPQLPESTNSIADIFQAAT